MKRPLHSTRYIPDYLLWKMAEAEQAFIIIRATLIEREGMSDVEAMCDEALKMLRGNMNDQE